MLSASFTDSLMRFNRLIESAYERVAASRWVDPAFGMCPKIYSFVGKN